MSTDHGKNSIAIIGAGLVGGAVLRELVFRWCRRSRRQTTADRGGSLGAARFPDIDRVYITSRQESTLDYQLQKTINLINQDNSFDIEQYGRLEISISKDTHCLSIKADQLDILPESLAPSTVEDAIFRRKSKLYSYLARTRPNILVIGANLAAIVAYTKELGEVQTLVLTWLLTTLKQAVDELGIDTVTIVGTTALGGQGTNMVWTHQGSLAMDYNLTSKILAAYGILGVLDRMSWDTDSTSRWILLTPGSLLGYDYLGFGPVKYFSMPEGLPREVEEVVHNSGLGIPLYEPMEVNLASLSGDTIQWNERRITGAFLIGANVKCGETGQLSPCQFGCISHAFQMGFNTDVSIARILIDELTGKTTGYNQIPLGAGKVIEPNAQGQNERNFILQRLMELDQENGKRSPPVYPALGSTRAQKEIVLADLLYRVLTDRFGKPTLQQVCEYSSKALAEDLWSYLQSNPLLLAEITAVIPVISPDGQIYTGPHVMYFRKGINRTSDLAELVDKDNFLDFAMLGAVDLRPDRKVVVHKLKEYETGVEVLIRRAQFIVNEYVGTFSPEAIDKGGSAIDPRIRHWKSLASGPQILLDPVFFVIQFLGGERPYQ